MGSKQKIFVTTVRNPDGSIHLLINGAQLLTVTDDETLRELGYTLVQQADSRSPR